LPNVTKNRIALAIVSICILAQPAMADETGFYVGANALNLSSTYRRATLDDGFTAAFGGASNGFSMGPSSVERSHYSWTVDIGYMLTRNFGVELSFLDFAPFRYSGYGTVTSSTDGNADHALRPADGLPPDPKYQREGPGAGLQHRRNHRWRCIRFLAGYG